MRICHVHVFVNFGWLVGWLAALCEHMKKSITSMVHSANPFFAQTL